MFLKFFGGAQEVGRSAIMLKEENSLLLDYGIKLNAKIEYPATIPNVDAFILSHAHLDHSGFAPALYNEMLVPAFGTEPTLALSELLLDDSLNIAKKEHMTQRFHKRQIESFKRRYTAMEYGIGFEFEEFGIELLDAGHISGSAITAIDAKGAGRSKRIVYTGDFKLDPQCLHKGATVAKSDVLITESTYATREHPDRETLLRKLASAIKETLDNKGTALLPVFAVGRSQEILTFLYKNDLIQYVYLDGMARAATSIVVKHPEFINNHSLLEKALAEATVIKDRDDREDALSSPSILLTTAGMLSGGPVLNYITKLRANSSIFLTGYQVEGTNGSMLMETGTIMVDKKLRRIETPVFYYDLSAHSGMRELYEYIKRSSPSTVVCVHGDQKNAVSLAENLKLEGYETYAPKIGDTIKLD
jgi:putative mRNA 3-end processing factor